MSALRLKSVKMALGRKTQVNLACHIIAIDELTDDPKITKELNDICAELWRVAGTKDNGAMFDVSEYLHEKVKRLESGGEYTEDSWEAYAYNSLMKQLED